MPQTHEATADVKKKKTGPVNGLGPVEVVFHARSHMRPVVLSSFCLDPLS